MIYHSKIGETGSTAPAADVSALQADPPLLTGGLRQEVMLGAGIDFLTVTVPLDVGQALIDQSVMDRVGTAYPGFKRSELRECLGGKVWRRLEPHQPSNRFGDAYESWEWSGPAADAAARFLQGRELRPSRVDVKFDFACEGDLTACMVLESLRSHFTDRRLTAGVSGDEPYLTRYIGSKTSDRRIRIYRKDIQDPAIGAVWGPTMRIELVLKGEHAEAWWEVHEQNRASAFGAAAAHIESMTGLRVIDGITGIPEMMRVSGTDEAKRVHAMVDQYCSLLAVCAENGVDVIALAKEKVKRLSDSGTVRVNRLRKGFRRVGAGNIESIVRSMIAGPDRVAKDFS